MGSTKDPFRALRRKAVAVGGQENTPSLNLGGHWWWNHVSQCASLEQPWCKRCEPCGCYQNEPLAQQAKWWKKEVLCRLSMYQLGWHELEKGRLHTACLATVSTSKTHIIIIVIYIYMAAYEINIQINLMYHIIHTLVNNLTLAQVWNCQEQLAIFPNEDIDISKMLPNVVSALDLRIPPEVPSATHAQDILQQLWKEWPENFIKKSRNNSWRLCNPPKLNGWFTWSLAPKGIGDPEVGKPIIFRFHDGSLESFVWRNLNESPFIEKKNHLNQSTISGWNFL